MANIKIAYATTNTAMAITLADLGNNTARASLAVDNTSDNYVDTTVSIQLQNGQVTGSDLAWYVYGYGSVNNSLFDTPSSGTNASVLTTPANLALLKTVSINYPPFSNTNFYVVIGSIAKAFGGILPPYWGIVIDNRTGASLVNTATNHAVTHRGIYYTNV